MRITCRLVFKYEQLGEQAITIIERALRTDNYQFVKTRVKGKKLYAEIKSRTIQSLHHTLEDYLTCLALAEKLTSKIADKFYKNYYD
jgi:hypothetical protein